MYLEAIKEGDTACNLYKLKISYRWSDWRPKAAEKQQALKAVKMKQINHR